MNSHLKEIRWINIFLVFSVAVFIITLYQRWITGDDAWFAEQAYWFLMDGYVHSELFEGVSVYEGQHLVYHKLHIWLGSLVIWIFGWNAYFLKAISLVSIFIFLFVVRSFIRKRFKDQETNLFSIFCILFFINTIVVLHGFEYRPDITMMLTGFVSYVFLRELIDHKHWSYALISGIMTGITMLLHINGLIFLLAGVSLLLIEKIKFKYIIVFLCGCTLSFSVYFFEMLSIEKLQEYYYELTNSPAVSDDDKTFFGVIRKILYEPKRYTHHIFEFLYLMLLVLVVSVNWRYIRGHGELRLIFNYFLSLTFFMSAIVTGSKTVYLLYTLPYLLLIVSVLFKRTICNGRVKQLFIMVLVFYTVTNIGRNYTIYERQNGAIVDLHARIVNKYNILDDAEILAPITFIFNEIPNTRVQSILPFIINYKNDYSIITLKLIFTDIANNKKSFAILTDDTLEDLRFSPEVGKTYYGYKYLGVEETLHVFKLEN